MTRCVALFFCLLLVIGCDTNERLNRLEKENADLRAQLSENQAARDLDLQAKCAKDAKSFVNDNWALDKDTIFFSFKNHYNKSSNTCVVEVEQHTSILGNGWSNYITLWNVYEHSKYGELLEDHLVDPTFKSAPRVDVISCGVAGGTCTSLDQFNSMADPYLTN